MHEQSTNHISLTKSPTAQDVCRPNAASGGWSRGLNSDMKKSFATVGEGRPGPCINQSNNIITRKMKTVKRWPAKKYANKRGISLGTRPSHADKLHAYISA